MNSSAVQVKAPTLIQIQGTSRFQNSAPLPVLSHVHVPPKFISICLAKHSVRKAALISFEGVAAMAETLESRFLLRSRLFVLRSFSGVDFSL